MEQFWEHKYFEKNSYELHSNIFRSLEIEQYLKQLLKKQGFNLYKHKLNFSNFTLNIFLSVYKTEQKILSNNKTVFSNEKKLKKKIINYLKKKSIKNIPTKTKYVKILKLYKSCLSKLKNKEIKLNTLSKKIIKSLNLFTQKKYNIILTIQEVNFINFNPNTEKALVNFRKFEKSPFFKEGVNLLTPLVTQKNSAKLLSDFIVSQLKTKRHNFFFNFLKENLNFILNQKFSKIKGIKIIIKGRLNNAARSRHYMITLGKIPLITIKSKTNYSESTAFTSNGTIGIKVWICEKN